MSQSRRTGWSEKVRQLAQREYIEPARGSRATVRINFGDLKAKLLQMGFPQGNANQVASPLETPKFWKPLGIEMCSPKGQARTVDSVLEFRFVGEHSLVRQDVESSSEKARRLTGRLKGLMRDVISEHGGTEGFLRWVRSDEDEE